MRTLAFRSPLVSRLSEWDIFANCQVASVRNLYHVPSHIISYHLISSHIPSGCHADFQAISFLRQAKRPQEVLTLRFCNIPRGDQRVTGWPTTQRFFKPFFEPLNSHPGFCIVASTQKKFWHWKPQAFFISSCAQSQQSQWSSREKLVLHDLRTGALWSFCIVTLTLW